MMAPTTCRGSCNLEPAPITTTTAVCLEITSQAYVNHYFKKWEEAMLARKLTQPKQMRTIKVK